MSQMRMLRILSYMSVVATSRCVFFFFVVSFFFLVCSHCASSHSKNMLNLRVCARVYIYIIQSLLEFRFFYIYYIFSLFLTLLSAGKGGLVKSGCGFHEHGGSGYLYHM